MIIKTVIIFLVVLSTLNVFSQSKCKPGETYIIGMSTSSLTIKGGCYPDSTAKRIMNAFWKNMCLEASFAIWSENLQYDDHHKWDDSLGCISKENWRMRNGGKWVEITKKEYDSLRTIKQ
jgi:hypothetical protein